MSPHENLPPARHRSRPVSPCPVQPPAAELSAGSGTEPRPYEVGYGKPPISTRFQKGQSGNPKGRKKGSKNLDTMLLSRLGETVAVQTPKGRQKVSRIEVIILKLIEAAGKGNIRAIEQLLRHYATAQAATAPAQPIAPAAAEDLTATDAATLALLREMLLAEALRTDVGEGAS